ncbi:SpoIIE family protein phosphatase [Streptomyces sp. NBRC 110028]|uniref:SpoIIE family protein phosphatase n=1 Tax=Streptomyces sp. NBRC 110028 TaxID=1621260 RepID=UPI0006E1FD7D|nr:SpoIIE family protein phosphatase [Streptomyces sp. NBRC 110028]
MSGGEPSLDALAAAVERLRGELTAAREAADAAVLIGIATGILVERGHGGPTEAARHLEELARAAGLPLPELAADVVNGAAGDTVARALPGALQGSVGARHDAPEVLRLRAAEAGSLTGDAQTVVDTLLEQALAPLGVSAVALWAVASGGALVLAGHAGFPRGEGERWRYVPPGLGVPAQRALTEQRAHWFPAMPADAAGIGRRQGGDGARAVLPAEANGRVLGVLEVCWPHPRPPLSGPVNRQLNALAGLCAHALPGTEETAIDAAADPALPVGPAMDLAEGLLDPVLVLRPVLDDRDQVTDFVIACANQRFTDPAGRPRATLTGMRLLEAYPRTAREGGLYERVLRVHATGEPFRAEGMSLRVLADDVPRAGLITVGIGRYGDAVLLSWRLEDEAARLAALLEHVQRLGRIGGFQQDAVSGEILWNSHLFSLFDLPPTAPPVPVERLHRHAHPDDSVAIGRFLRTLLHHRHAASTAFRMQRADGAVRHIRVVAEPVTDPAGHLLAVRGAYQDFSSQHWTEVALAATRDRLADTEQEAAERNRLALQLQRAIMPSSPAPVDIAGLHVAVRYRPAEKGHLVGGDWYDVVVLPQKKVLLAVGDVAGHGIEAATSMVVLRNALRGLAATGAGPAQLLGWLNTVAHHLTEQVTATVVCGIYDPPTRMLDWARAGHPPPVLIHGGTAAALPLPGGILLGAVAEATYEERRLALVPGDRLLMYTDGLIERRDRSVEKALEQLLATVGAATRELGEHLDVLLTHARSDTDDDTCLIGIDVS